MLLGKFLVGSNNYNLDLPESDKDYKGVVMPNFTDLYFNKTLNAQIDEHKSLVDYRFFCQKLAKANPNYVEMLFSKEKEFLDDGFMKIFDLARETLPSFLRLSWDNFVLATLSMARNSLKRTDQESKMVARAVFLCHLLERAYEKNGELINSDWTDHNFRAIRVDKTALKEAKEQLPYLLSFDKKLSLKDNDFELIHTFNEEVKLYFRNYLTKH